MSRFQEYIESDQGPEDLCREIEKLTEILKNRESFIDFVNSKYPGIVQEYLEIENK